jgi:hypothetical protein
VSEFRVAVLTPSTGICRVEYAQSLAKMVGYFSQVRVYEDCESQMLVTDSIIGSGIGANYETMVRKWLADDRGWTHFLSFEDDMMVPADALHRLAAHRVDIVGCNYSTNKGRPLRFTAGNCGRRFATREDSTGIEEVDLLPQGFTLVSRKVYETLPEPWYTGGMMADYYFSEKARLAGFKVYVDHDVSKETYHIGPYVYTYRDALRDYEVQEVENGR